MIAKVFETRGRVLIVDDDPCNHQILAPALEAAGFEVIASADGRCAFSAVEDFNPDVMLLDLMMPGRDGFEFCKLLKANPRTDSISVIFMTGLDDSANRRRGLSCGADDFVAKPFDADDVVLRVSRAVANKRSTEKLDNLHGDLEKLKLRIDGLFSALMSGQIPFRGGIPKFFDRRRKNLGPQARNGGIDAEHAIELRAMPELRAAL